MPYAIAYNDWVQHLSGGDVVMRYTCDARERFGSSPPIEEQIRRLADLIGRVADASGINLMEIIGPDEIKDYGDLAYEEGHG